MTCPPRTRPSFARPTRGHGHLPQPSLLSTPSHPTHRTIPVMIEAHELTRRYGDTTAVHSLSFTIAPETVTEFLSPNGAGKSTCSGVRPLRGEVRGSSRLVHRRHWRPWVAPA